MVRVSRQGVDVGPIRASAVNAGLMLAGIILVYTGLRNITIADYLRSVIKLGPAPAPASGGLAAATKQASEESRVVEGGGTINVAPGGTATGAAVAEAAQSFVGRVPYVWAGETPDGWDCSGMVSYILHVMFNIELPNDTHTLASGFYTWSGAKTVTNPVPGDLACWVSHVGIMIDGNRMVSATNPFDGTRIDDLSTWPPAVYRRPLAYGQGRNTGRGD